MTLSVIKNKITEYLSKLTIDDFYSDPQVSFAKQTFSEMTKLNTDEEFENFLCEKFPETTVETFRFSLEQAATDLQKQIFEVDEKIKSSQNKIGNIETEITIIKEKHAEFPKHRKKTKSEITDIEMEINQIKPLSKKSPYDNQIIDLEKDKEKKNNILESYHAASLQLQTESNDLQAIIKIEYEFITQAQYQIKTLQTLVEKKGQELEELKEKENTHFKDEFSSLEFLFKILLHKKIQTYHVYERRKTGGKITGYNNKIIDEEENVKTGKINLDIESCTLEEVCEFILPFTNSQNIIPINWRKILEQNFSNQLFEFAGQFTPYVYFTREKLKLTHPDLTTILATKSAISTKYSIKTAENKIILAVSGGIAVSISFREKGQLISKFQKKPFEIFTRCLKPNDYEKGENSTIFQTLYHHTGYARSSVKIETPDCYYILTDKFVIELEFIPAPILFDNNSVINFASNISAIAKLNDEDDD